MVCNACGSFRHLVKECPYSYEKNKGVHAVEEVPEQEDNESVNLTAKIEEKFQIERFILFTSDQKELS